MNARLAVSCTDDEDIGDEVQKLDTRHIIIQVRIIGDISNLLFAGQGLIAHGVSIDRDFARVKLQNACHGLKRSGFASAVMTDKAINFARQDVQAQVVHRFFIAIGLGQMFNFKHCYFSSPFCKSPRKSPGIRSAGRSICA